MTQGSRPTVPTAEVLLDRPRHLKFDFNAAARFEAATGKNLFANNVLGEMSATSMRALLWACLVWEDPELTQEQVGEMIHFGNINDLTGKLTDVYVGSMPKADGKRRPPAASPGPNGTG